jgi:hypothetical protein
MTRIESITVKKNYIASPTNKQSQLTNAPILKTDGLYQ